MSIRSFSKFGAKIQIYFSISGVRKHFKKFHGHETPYFCKSCTLVFKCPETVQIHMENEHGIANVVVAVNNVNVSPVNVKKVKCIVCNLRFENGTELSEHRSEAHFYKCGDCDKEYKLTDSLRKHVKVTHNENVTMTCCKYCDKVFLDPTLKNGHLANFHPDIHSNSSENSNNSIIEVSNNSNSATKIEILSPLNNGLAKNNENNGSKMAAFKCPKCPKTYNIGKSLRKHCRKNHNKLSICFCHHCPKVCIFNDFLTIFCSNFYY